LPGPGGFLSPSQRTPGRRAFGLADPALKALCTEMHTIRRLSLGLIIRILRRRGVREWTMAGKFHKHLIFRPRFWLHMLPDWRLIRFLYFRKRKDNADDSILLGLIDELRAEGLECQSALDLCPELLVKSGILTRREPTAAELKDIAFGWVIAKEMGRLDIGQSVMIRNRAVMAIEAIEGTDQAILRAGELCQNGAFTVIKVAKPQQDMRFDVPTVGIQTIETMRQAGAKMLAIEAGKTILMDAAEVIAKANSLGICIAAYESAPLE
jgi:UDP-2,3-diacylglucosamine hydrolase